MVGSLAVACSGGDERQGVGGGGDEVEGRGDDGQGEGGGEACWRVAADEKLDYVLERSAILEPGGELVILDILGDRFQRLSRQGKVVAETDWDGVEGGWEDADPLRFERRGEVVVMELAGSRFVGLAETAEGEVLWAVDLWNPEIEGLGDASLLVREWTWTGRDLLVLGSVRWGEDGEEERVMVVRAGRGRGEVEVLLELPGEREVAEFSRMGQTTYATTVAGRAAVLLMREEPQIFVETGPGGELKPLEAMPAGLEARPVIEHLDWNHPVDFPVVHEEVEASTMPVGLFGWRGKLFVLHRAPEGETTSWWLSRIDPGADVVEARARLPTDANHLTVAVGEERWAFLEKGPIRGYGVQSVESVLFIPGEMVEGAEMGGAMCSAPPP
ncbi:MAG: hypothetical protein ACOC92_01010 [bacterium]